MPSARLALVLGFVAIIAFPAGLAAIIYGWVALRRIAREGGRPAGRGYAQAGIALGVVFGILSPLSAATLALPAIKMIGSMIKTDDPQVVREVAARFGGDPPPAWMLPRHAEEARFQGARSFSFVDHLERPRVFFSAHEMQKLMGRAIIEERFNSPYLVIDWPQTTTGSRQLAWGPGATKTSARTSEAAGGNANETPEGDSAEKRFFVDVTAAMGTDNVPLKRYKTIVERRNTTFGLVLVTPEAPLPNDPQSHYFSEEEVRQLFESYVFPSKANARRTN